ncbi:MAG: hypothetical protein O7F08_09265, partial [Deltaproteobacteria bacterium]|nr:hypothetical protein [Deltaproteobacteria bacterium]
RCLRILPLFVLLFLFYFTIGQTLARSTHIFRTEWLSIDSPKIARTLTDPRYVPPKHRQLAHPLFALFFRPIGTPLARAFGGAHVAIAFNAFFAAAGLIAFLAVLRQLGLPEHLAWTYSSLLGVSTVHLLYGSLPETFIYAFASLVLMPLVFLGIESDRRFVGALAVVTFFSAGITLTNGVFGLLWLGARFWSHPKRQQLQFALAFAGLTVAMLVAGLAMQASLYPRLTAFASPDFFGSHARFLSNEVFEHPLSFVGERLPYFLVHSVIAPAIVDNPHGTGDRYGLDLQAIPITWFPALLLYLPFVGMSLYVVYKDRRYANRPFVVFALYFAYNVCLHMFYGASYEHLYGAHYAFALVGLFAFAFYARGDNDHGLSREQRILRGLLLGLCLAVTINNLAFLYRILAADS